MNDELKSKELNAEDLNQAAGGNSGTGAIHVGNVYYPNVQAGTYLALRSDPSYNESNEIGPLWPGSEVLVTSYNGGTYATVTVNYCAKGPYGNDVSGRVGYVNVNYLQ